MRMSIVLDTCSFNKLIKEQKLDSFCLKIRQEDMIVYISDVFFGEIMGGSNVKYQKKRYDSLFYIQENLKERLIYTKPLLYFLQEEINKNGENKTPPIYPIRLDPNPTISNQIEITENDTNLENQEGEMNLSLNPSDYGLDFDLFEGLPREERFLPLVQIFIDSHDKISNLKAETILFSNGKYNYWFAHMNLSILYLLKPSKRKRSNGLASNIHNDHFHIIQAVYSDYLVTEDKKLLQICDKLKKVLPFEAINIKYFFSVSSHKKAS